MREAVTAMQEDYGRERACPARPRHRREHNAKTGSDYFEPLHGKGFRSRWRVNARHRGRRAETSLPWL